MLPRSTEPARVLRGVRVWGVEIGRVNNLRENNLTGWRTFARKRKEGEEDGADKVVLPHLVPVVALNPPMCINPSDKI